MIAKKEAVIKDFFRNFKSEKKQPLNENAFEIAFSLEKDAANSITNLMMQVEKERITKSVFYDHQVRGFVVTTAQPSIVRERNLNGKDFCLISFFREEQKKWPRVMFSIYEVLDETFDNYNQILKKGIGIYSITTEIYSVNELEIPTRYLEEHGYRSIKNVLQELAEKFSSRDSAKKGLSDILDEYGF